ncbi:MAG TPA: hypothetical protein VG276_27820 [Actinomycetes bacterium]|jgi:hypothetical protein|nr:hypothetical protein [Actinomycetes bacterium]
MPRQPDLQSPAAQLPPPQGDCIADTPAFLLEQAAAYHGNAEPEPIPVDPEELT